MKDYLERLDDGFICEWDKDITDPTLCDVQHKQFIATKSCIIMGFILYSGLFCIVGYINYTFIIRDKKFTSLPTTIKIALPCY